jgi:hypothetical protein
MPRRHIPSKLIRPIEDQQLEGFICFGNPALNANGNMVLRMLHLF